MTDGPGSGTGGSSSGVTAVPLQRMSRRRLSGAKSKAALLGLCDDGIAALRPSVESRVADAIFGGFPGNSSDTMKGTDHNDDLP